jgi:hypothetical protein
MLRTLYCGKCLIMPCFTGFYQLNALRKVKANVAGGSL